MKLLKRWYETMKLLRSTKNKITKDENAKNLTHL